MNNKNAIEMKGRRICGAVAGVFAGMIFSASAMAASVLFVSDSQTDTNIPAILTADGHSVTTVLDDFTSGPNTNAVLSGNLSAYDVIVWSETGTGSGGTIVAATATNLSNWVSGGGRLFVTGYDSLISPDDPVLQGLVGGGSANDVGPNPGPVINAVNHLTTGLIDIRGVTPSGGYSDQDSLGTLGGSTVCVVADTDNAGACHWTLLPLGAGEIAYVSNGDIGPSSAHASWNDTSAGGAGAYNAALRNFVSASGTAAVASVPTLSEYALVLLALVVGLVGWRSSRSRLQA